MQGQDQLECRVVEVSTTCNSTRGCKEHKEKHERIVRYWKRLVRIPIHRRRYRPLQGNRSHDRYAKYKGLPAPKAGVLVSGALFLVGAVAVAVAAIAQGDFAVYGVYGALAIALVMFPTAIIFHNFWKETDPQAKQTEMMSFNKDIALAGAALVLAFVFSVINDPSILG
jgi:uncharacterized membrane protein YphA (DoxX/SURF4 family)